MSEQQIHRAKRNAAFLAAMFGLGTLAHLGRDIWLARSFGTGRGMEAFELVFVLPGMLARFFGGGMLTALIPRASALLDRSGLPTRRFWGFHAEVWARSSALLLLLVAAGLLFSDRLVSVLAWGSAQELDATATELMRVLLPSLLVTVTLGVAIAACHTLQRYVVPSVAGLLAPLCYLAFLIWGAERLGIRAAALGFLIGQSCALLLLAIYLLRAPRSDSPAIGSAQAGETLRAIGLVLASWLTAIINLQVDLSMASTLEAGSVPSLRYAFRLVQLPAGLFFSTVGVVLLPTVSRAIAGGDGESLQRGLRFACRVVAVLLFPAAVGLHALAPQIIELLYQRGAFEAADSLRTAFALRAYAPAIVAYGYLNVVLTLLHARRRQGTAALIGLLLAGANAALNALLMPRFGVAGIAASTSLVVIANVLIVAAIEPSLRETARSRLLYASLLRSAVACAAMWLALRLVGERIEVPEGSWITLLAQLAIAAAVFAAVLGSLRGGEFSELRKAIARRSP